MSSSANIGTAAQTDLEERLQQAEDDKSAIEQKLEERREEAEVEKADRTRRAKGMELAERTYAAGQDRLARDTTDLPELRDLSKREVRTGFALLRSDTPSAFAAYVAQSIELIEDYEGDVLDVKYFLNRSTHFVALTYNVKAPLVDIIAEAIRQLKRLNSA